MSKNRRIETELMKRDSRYTYRSINQLAIPATIAGIAEPVLSLTDTAIVGNLPVNATESLAAVGIVGAFLSMLVWVLGQTRSAISAILSQYLGAGKLDEVRSLPAQAILLNVSIGILLIGVTIPFEEEIFLLMNANGIIMEYCMDYYGIRVWGFPLTLFTFAIIGVFRGLQNTFWPMAIALTGTVLNIVLDYVLVFGRAGLIAPMGLQGAAWASLSAQVVMAIMALVLVMGKTRFEWHLSLPLNPELGRLIVMSLNLFIRTLVLNAVLILAVREATALGNAQIAAHTIAVNLWLFSAFFIDGYSSAGNIIGGRLYGAGDGSGLWSMAKKVLGLGESVALGLMALMLLAVGPIAGIFTRDGRVLEAFYDVFPIVMAMLPVNAIAFVFDGIFKGLGKMRYLRNTLLLATLVGFIPSLYVNRYLGLGLQGIWWAIGLWMVFRSLPLIVKFYLMFRPMR